MKIVKGTTVMLIALLSHLLVLWAMFGFYIP